MDLQTLYNIVGSNRLLNPKSIINLLRSRDGTILTTGLDNLLLVKEIKEHLSHLIKS